VWLKFFIGSRPGAVPAHGANHCGQRGLYCLLDEHYLRERNFNVRGHTFSIKPDILTRDITDSSLFCAWR
jgi:hypothetical protein